MERGLQDRAALERFIAQGYAKAYGARITHYADELVGVRNPDGSWAAALGFTLAGHDRLFVEHYLDRPVEHAIGEALGISIDRRQIVEVGNLAAPGSGAARHLITCMTRLLHDMRRTWVVFTSTRPLLNSFRRLGIATITLARAEPSRLPDAGESWGTYYDTDPRVVTANIPLGFIHLGSAQRSSSEAAPAAICHPRAGA